MNPQEFLNNRLSELKNLVTGNTSIENAASMIAPGGIAGKAGLRTGLGMLKTAGKPGAAKMGLLGGDAPVYETNYDKLLNTRLKDIPTGLSNVVQDIY